MTWPSIPTRKKDPNARADEHHTVPGNTVLGTAVLALLHRRLDYDRQRHEWPCDGDVEAHRYFSSRSRKFSSAEPVTKKTGVCPGGDPPNLYTLIHSPAVLCASTVATFSPAFRR
jgi:hypothetical protein